MIFQQSLRYVDLLLEKHLLLLSTLKTVLKIVLLNIFDSENMMDFYFFIFVIFLLFDEYTF